MKREFDGCYELDDDPSRVDVAAAHAYLGSESYWAKGRDLAVMEQLVREATRVVGLYAPDGAMVGFARALSDRHTVAYLADVYVLHDHQGRGLGTALLHMMIDDSGFEHVRWLLGTRDAHSLYRRVGFETPSQRIMERARAPRPSPA